MDNTLSILLIDDDAAIRRILSKELAAMGMTVAAADGADAALEHLRQHECDVAVLDVRMPGTSGDNLLPILRERWPELPVVMLTGHADLDLGIECMKRGAADFLTKPCSMDQLSMALRRAAEQRHLRESNATLLRHVAPRRSRGTPALAGASPALERVRRLMERVAATDEPVLILGESGTGKELVAGGIQAAGARAAAPFITVNCAAVTETLLESELFGHEKGAFSGADQRRIGFFELADGGTIFLDEIGDMPLPMQAKLLRVLQSGEMRRVGGSKPFRVDVRVIAATNKDLREEVRFGRFREDLLHRINTMVLELPPLRARLDDLAPLVERFAREFAEERGGKPLAPSDAALACLRAYPWPGNVRELRNVVRRACIMAGGPALEPEDLPGHVTRAVDEPHPSAEAAGGTGASETLADVERRHIMRVFNACGGNKTAAARALGIAVKTLYNKLEAWGLGTGAREDGEA